MTIMSPYPLDCWLRFALDGKKSEMYFRSILSSLYFS
jgi:hypothetical protein